MPTTTVVFFKDADGTVPVKEWLEGFVAKRDKKAVAKCLARIKYLEDRGLDCRRPYSDYLRDGVFELRAQHGNVNYRLLYFFAGSTAAVLAAGLTKEARIPDKDIETAIRRKRLFEADPGRHTYAKETE